MPFRLSDFQAQIRDLARVYQFEVEIIFPLVLGASNLVNILAESTAIPVKTMGEVDANFMGQPMKLAGTITYPAWSCTFRVDDNYDVYKKFRAWSELVVGTETNIAAFPRQYRSNINLYQLDGAGNRLISYQLINAWVSNVGEETLDYNNRNISLLPITFEFDYFLQDIP